MLFIFCITSGASDLGLRKCGYFPCCGQNSSMAAVTCTFKQFTLFFIPIFKFSKRYYISCQNCGMVYEIEKEEGKRIEHDYNSEINYDKMHTVDGYGTKVCPNCRCSVDPAARYCPNCGMKLF